MWHKRCLTTHSYPLWRLEYQLSTNAKLRGIPLLAKVFRELKNQLPAGVIGDEELLAAAQKFIELAKAEYISEQYHEPRIYHEYFSCDVVTAFESFQTRICLSESAVHNSDPLQPQERERLRSLMLGSNRDRWIETAYG